MSDLYTALRVSPRKKRCPPSDDSDDSVITPKKVRTASLLTPPRTAKRQKQTRSLPPHLSRLYEIHTALQHALSHALATTAVSPSSESGIIYNVLNHLSLTTYTGFSTTFSADDLRRLCWLWEWDGKTPPDMKAKAKTVNDDDDNPFLDKDDLTPSSKDWTRGSMGFVISSCMHLSRGSKKRVPAYGIGIEVEMDIDKDMGGGMAAIARWTAAGEARREQVRAKLLQWVELHADTTPAPSLPLADLPEISTQNKPSTLTQILASASPKSPSSRTLLQTPESPSRSKSPRKSPTKRIGPSLSDDFPVPLLPVIPSSRSIPATPSRSKNTILFPQTPASGSRGRNLATSLLTPRTPSVSPARSTASSVYDSLPSTPRKQTGSDAETVPETPNTSRRQALYERIRQRSLTGSPTKPTSAVGSIQGGSKMTRDQLLKMTQEETRRRCLLGRLGGIAESVWMLFSSPVGSTTSSLSPRKRRALPFAEVSTAALKSSPVPISSAEASDSIELLVKLCPFFLKQFNVGSEEWLEMPAGNMTSTGDVDHEDSILETPSKSKAASASLMASPGRVRRKEESAIEVITRSPRTVKHERGGLREVRERIRRELELLD
ncbi:hypothetical protein OE88DRAFT_1804615 [Heliocybe sulcata]|uniref:DNA replication factor Cdt1 C-terminal domain-containing protein n=1 Tax=Heliocybe sulcata TaxID=5364 RepID=A0A5C3NEQ5_9AGAM|nr:hypothetical protein OE88DRAFT_1804615 [Heliocybe sulcata]